MVQLPTSATLVKVQQLIWISKLNQVMSAIDTWTVYWRYVKYELGQAARGWEMEETEDAQTEAYDLLGKL